MTNRVGFEFQPGELYIMPAHFGHRTAEDDGCYEDVTTTILVFETDPDAAARLLPPGFEPTDPATLIVIHAECRGVHYLAGRDYNLLGVNIGARFRGTVDEAEGSYAAVMWEDVSMPVILGREFLGVPKFVDDVSRAWIRGGSRGFGVSEHGTTLVVAEVQGLTPLDDAQVPEVQKQLDARAWMAWRLLPTLDGRGLEVSYPTLIDVQRQLDAVWLGTGSVEFKHVTREQAPQSHLIANGLADLPILEHQMSAVTHGSLVQGKARRLT